MDRTTFLVIELLSLLVVASVCKGSLSAPQNSRNAVAASTKRQKNQDEDATVATPACQRTSLCCRLGRKAVRNSYMASVYTCKIEALVQGLKYHRSATYRLSQSGNGQTQTDRMDVANSLQMSYGFRWRLKVCEAQGREQRLCFQDCCERKLREEQERARKTLQRQRQEP